MVQAERDVRDAISAARIRHPNNFDLIRILAALEVVVGHAVDRLGLIVPSWLNPLYVLIRWFPGVPIFFALSGYLLTKSLVRNDNLLSYARNRAVRIFPALWGCTLATIGLLAIAGLLSATSIGKTLAFAVGQGTIGQFWVPAPFDQWGLGGEFTPNPSLWTIRVEIGFYLILPIVLIVGRALFGRGRNLIGFISAIAITSFLMAAVLGNSTPSNPLVRLIAESPMPYLWLFLLGALGALNDDRLKKLVINRTLQWTGLFLVFRTLVYLSTEIGPDRSPPSQWLLNSANLWLVPPVFALAFSQHPFVRRLHPTIDISYGVYLWHMVVVNTLVHWAIASGFSAFVIVIVGSIVLGTISWYAVEKPALTRLKAR